MLPEITIGHHASAPTVRRRKDIKSPKTDRDYKSDVLSNNLSPKQRFKPIDFKENLIISINCTEAMRVKEYEKLCDLAAKFEQKQIRDQIKMKGDPKEFGHYAKRNLGNF